MSLHGYDIGVIIPAYNEEASVGATINALKEISCIDTILVVDDGSKDSTTYEAKKNGVHVLTLSKNMGKANAMKEGYNELRHSVLVFLDADLGASAKDAYKLIEPICLRQTDITVARFPMTPGKGGFGLVKKLAAWGLIILTGKKISSVLSGQRAFLRCTLNEDIFQYSGFGIEFGMTVEILKKDLKILEVDVDMTHRTTGKDIKGFIHRYHQFKDISRVIIKKLLSFGG